MMGRLFLFIGGAGQLGFARTQLVGESDNRFYDVQAARDAEAQQTSRRLATLPSADDGSSSCVDTDTGITDSWWNDCSEYDVYPTWCGNYDDSDFSSNDVCCECGGGETPSSDCWEESCGKGCTETVCDTTSSPTVSPVPTQETTASPTAARACFPLVMFDSEGDSWNGARYFVRDAETDSIIHAGTMQSDDDDFFFGGMFNDDGGSGETVELCLNRTQCLTLEVTSGQSPDEISWTFGGTTVSGGAPYGPAEIWVDDGVLNTGGACPTPAPTVTFQPTPVPSTAAPSITARPTLSPSLSPTQSPTVARACFPLVMFDSVGDSWNGASYFVRDAETDRIIHTGTMQSDDDDGWGFGGLFNDDGGIQETV